MINLSVCTDAVFHKWPLESAFRTMKSADISAIEFWSYENKDLTLLKQLCTDYQIQIAAFCTSFFNLVDASQHDIYLDNLIKTIEIAKMAGCHKIITQVGNDLNISRAIQHENLVKGLKLCVPYLEEAAVMLVIEPLNVLKDHTGYYLSSSDEAVDIIKEVGSEHVKLLFDIYHQQITEGDLIRRIQEYIPYIGHFHAAGNPGRNELYYGEINYPAVFRAIKETGYDGYIGLEYFPTDDAAKGFLYAKELLV